MFKNNLSTTIKPTTIPTATPDSSKLDSSITKIFYLPVDNYGRTEIHTAAIKGQVENMFWDISSDNFYLDQLDCCGRSALHYASTRGEAKAVQILLLHGASQNIADIYGYTPLHYAAEGGHTSVVRELIHNKSELHSQAKGGIIPLHLASLNGHLETQKLLLDSGTDINRADSSGGTALHFASLMGYLSIVQVLIARDANVNVLTLNGKTPLNYADNFEEVKKLLLGHGATLGQGIPDPADPIYLAMPLPDKDYAEEDQMLGDICNYFNAL